MDSTPPLIAFIGPSGSGKTTLIEKLIGRLSSDGFRVGAIKHSHHEIDIDKKGKDSFRFREAGSNPTIVTGRNFIGFMETTAETVCLADLARHFRGKADIIIVEGFKSEPVMKFVFGPPFEDYEDGSPEDDKTLGFITMQSGAAPDSGKPVFHRDEVEALAGWITEHYLN